MASSPGMKKGKMELIEPKVIRTDLDTQPRIKVDWETVELYVETMRKGIGLPRILLFKDKTIDGYILIDGWHRLEAHKQVCPDYPIQAVVVTGTLEEARWFSYGMNATHGLNRSNADKNRAVRLALQHKMGVDKSNCEIAAHVGVNEKLVRRVREELESTSALPKSAKRVGRDGRAISTDKIGRSKKQPAVKETAIVVPKEEVKIEGTVASDNPNSEQETAQLSASPSLKKCVPESEQSRPEMSTSPILIDEQRFDPVELAPYLLAYDVVKKLPEHVINQIPSTHYNDVARVRNSETDRLGILHALVETALGEADDETQERLLRNVFRAKYGDEKLVDKIMGLVAEENKNAESR